MNVRFMPFVLLSAVALAALLPRAVPAVPAGGAASSGDVAWMLTATALVLLMTPGLSFFYGGMVRFKNVVSTMLQSFVAMGVISLLWVVVGFSLAFGDSLGGLVGNPRTFFMFDGVGGATHPDLSPTIPLLLFALFQLKFAIITPALITGAFAERVRFSSYLLFMVLFSLFIYAPLAHMDVAPGGLPAAVGRARLRRRNGRAHVGGLRGAGGRAGARASPEPHRQRGARAGQHAVRAAGHRHAVVRLVRLQRGLGAGGQRHGGARLRHHQHGVGRGDARLGVLRHGCAAASLSHGRLHRRGGRAGRDHARRRASSPSAQSIVIGLVASIVSNLAVHLKSRSTLDDTLDVFPCHGVGGMVGMS